MGYAKMNIWLRSLDCRLITDCWRADFVIKTCSGIYLTDMDKTLLTKIQTQYSDFASVSILPMYQGETRISMRRSNSGGPFFNHVEMEIPPGCYVVWARVCHGRNEETNKVMVIVRCGEEACVNLLLNTVDRCAREAVHPVFVKAFERQIPIDDKKAFARVAMNVGEIKRNVLMQQVNERLVEVGTGEGNIPNLVGVYNEIYNMLAEMSGDCC